MDRYCAHRGERCSNLSLPPPPHFGITCWGGDATVVWAGWIDRMVWAAQLCGDGIPLRSSIGKAHSCVDRKRKRGGSKEEPSKMVQMYHLLVSATQPLSATQFHSSDGMIWVARWVGSGGWGSPTPRADNPVPVHTAPKLLFPFPLPFFPFFLSAFRAREPYFSKIEQSKREDAP